jgi:glycosyltransferase involved in cell wall biosynthesis
VFYTWEQAKVKVFDEKFGKEIKWDIPLLEGYEFTFVKNTSHKPNSHTIFGIINPTLIAEIRQWNADAVLVFGWNHYSHLQVMFHFKNKIPVLFRGDSTLLDELKNFKSFARSLWLKFVYKHIDYALYVGTNNKSYFFKYGLKEKQLLFAPHAIDNDRFEDKSGEYTQKAEQWRKELGIHDDDVVFLFAGKFEAKKNPKLIIEAAKYFHKLKFIFVGNGILEDELKNAAIQNVIFLPFQNQSLMPIVYRLANVLILPSSYNETWGLVVNEAMVSGLAVIVSDKVGCAVDLVENDVNGFVFKSNDLKVLSEKISFVCQNIPKFAQNSLKIISQWNYAKIAQSIENLLND